MRAEIIVVVNSDLDDIDAVGDQIAVPMLATLLTMPHVTAARLGDVSYVGHLADDAPRLVGDVIRELFVSEPLRSSMHAAGYELSPGAPSRLVKAAGTAHTTIKETR